MLRSMRFAGLALLMLLGVAVLATGCASSTTTGTPAPAGRPAFIFFYTDA